jgi:hypothetical protein
MLRSLVLATGLVAAAATPGLAQTRQAAVERFAANNAMFVLYHEVAHLMVDQLGLPVLGREEDAADNMATYMLLNKTGDQYDQALGDAALGWKMSDLGRGKRHAADFYDEHSLDVQRAYSIVCLMVGHDPSTFTAIADEYGIDYRRQQTCEADYDLVKRSLEGLLGTVGTKNGAPAQVEIRYNFVTGALAETARAFRRSGVFEAIAEDVRKLPGLTAPVRLTAKRCDEPNAFYVAEDIEILFCYELMDDFMGMADDILPAVADAPPGPTRAAGLGRMRTGY